MIYTYSLWYIVASQNHFCRGKNSCLWEVARILISSLLCIRVWLPWPFKLYSWSYSCAIWTHRLSYVSSFKKRWTSKCRDPWTYMCRFISWDLHGVFQTSMLLRCSLHASSTTGNHMYIQCFLFLLCPYYLSNKVFNYNLCLIHLALPFLTCLPGDETNFLNSYVPNCYNSGCPIRSYNPCP